MRGTDNPSVSLNEVYRLQPTLAGLLDILTRDLLPPLAITEWIGYSFPLWYASYLSRKPSLSRTFVALSRTGLIADTALPLMLCHQTYSSPLLPKRGTT